MPAQWGCVGLLGLPLKVGPSGPYLGGFLVFFFFFFLKIYLYFKKRISFAQICSTKKWTKFEHILYFGDEVECGFFSFFLFFIFFVSWPFFFCFLNCAPIVHPQCTRFDNLFIINNILTLFIKNKIKLNEQSWTFNL